MSRHAKIMSAAPTLPTIASDPEAQDTSKLALVGTHAGAQPDDEALEESLAFKSLMEVRKKRRRKRVIIGSVVGVALLGFAISAVLRTMAAPEEEVVAEDVTSFVYQGDFVDQVGATGTAQPVSSVVVTPEVDGIIESVSVVEGQLVNEGDTLFTVRNDALDRAVSEAASQVSVAQSSLDQAYREYNSARDSYNATQGLDSKIAEAKARVEQCTQANIQAQSALQPVQTAYEADPENTDLAAQYEQLYSAALKAQSDLETAQAALEALQSASSNASSASDAVSAASAGITSAKAALQSAEAAYADAVEAAGKRTVTSPITGSVLVMNAVTGASLGASATGGATELIRVADFTRMRVAIEVNEVDISRIAVGQKATVTFSALPDVSCEAVVESVSSVASGGEMSGGGGVVTYKVELVIEHPDENIKPGMSASVNIITQQVDDTLIVPTTALTTDVNGAACVTVVTRDENGEIVERTQRQVTVLAQSNTEAAIQGQLADGDEVLLGMGGSDGDDELGNYGDDGEIVVNDAA